MYSYEWDPETGGLILNETPPKVNREPRPVYSRELDVLGFDKVWNYPKTDDAPIMWAEASKYIYRGRKVAKRSGGTLLTPPEIAFFEAPEPPGVPLRPVDVDAMVEKNRLLTEKLEDETIKKIRDVYEKFKQKGAVFSVGFSGGKDSAVLLDLVKKAIPEKDFFVSFNDTGMELPETYINVDETKKECEEEGIPFVVSASRFAPDESWRLFGPPSRKKNRWCCSVHKSVPSVLKIRELIGNKSILSVAGVRAAESFARSKYNEVEKARKIKGELRFSPLLNWSSAEIWLYLFLRKIPVNIEYKKGFGRIGCIMCPHASDYVNSLTIKLYPDETKKYCDLIKSFIDKARSRTKDWLETGSWKGRQVGLGAKENFSFVEKEDRFLLSFKKEKNWREWREWYRTVGELEEIDKNNFKIEFQGVWRRGKFAETEDKVFFEVEKGERNRNSIAFFSRFKKIIIKALFCVRCGYCAVNCPFGNMEMDGDEIKINDSCTKCGACLKESYACIRYKSIK